MSVRNYEKTAFRIKAKLSSLVSEFVMFLRAPRRGRTADVHLLWQSEAQLKASLSLMNSGCNPGAAQKVIIIIPFRDQWEVTLRCLQSLDKQDFQNHRVVLALVDNGSVEQATAQGLENFMHASHRFDIRLFRYDIPFNFSRLNNWAVRDCRDIEPDVIFLCNNDIEFLENDAVARLVNFSRNQPNAGAVGCTLLYPNRRVQHLFVYVGSKIVGSHPHKGRRFKPKEVWYQKPRPVSAVTGAITLMRYQIFKDSGGLDENLGNSYQDVDLCLKFQDMGLVNWVVPNVIALHHEGKTRGRKPSWDEAEYMFQKWGSQISQNAFVHPKLNRCCEHFAPSIF